jgi:hypothetical protein
MLEGNLLKYAVLVTPAVSFFRLYTLHACILYAIFHLKSFFFFKAMCFTSYYQLIENTKDRNVSNDTIIT